MDAVVQRAEVAALEDDFPVGQPGEHCAHCVMLARIGGENSAGSRPLRLTLALVGTKHRSKFLW